MQCVTQGMHPVCCLTHKGLLEAAVNITEVLQFKKNPAVRVALECHHFATQKKMMFKSLGRKTDGELDSQRSRLVTAQYEHILIEKEMQSNMSSRLICVISI